MRALLIVGLLLLLFQVGGQGSVPGGQQILGIARYIANPDGESAEFAVVVTDAQLGRRTEGPVLAIHQSEATLAAMDPCKQAAMTAANSARRHRPRQPCSPHLGLLQ